jgi:predicted metal-dependent HD superfamily phosphohydrolase
MTKIDATREQPADRHRRWQQMWHQLGSDAPADGLLTELLHRYAEPQRTYHTLQHLDECFAHFDRVRAEAEHEAELELALWFHDAVYDVRGHNNELNSANWARAELLRAGAAQDCAGRVHALVMATCHNAALVTRDAQILVDVDLSILGAPTGRFDEYETQVRAEYAWVPEPVYRSQRASILQAFLDRDSIYNTRYFRAHCEDQARENLVRSIRQLAI